MNHRAIPFWVSILWLTGSGLAYFAGVALAVIAAGRLWWGEIHPVAAALATFGAALLGGLPGIILWALHSHLTRYE